MPAVVTGPRGLHDREPGSGWATGATIEDEVVRLVSAVCAVREEPLPKATNKCQEPVAAVSVQRVRVRGRVVKDSEAVRVNTVVFYRGEVDSEYLHHHDAHLQTRNNTPIAVLWHEYPFELVEPHRSLGLTKLPSDTRGSTGVLLPCFVMTCHDTLSSNRSQ